MSNWSIMSRSEKINWVVIPMLLLMLPITVAGALKIQSLNSKAAPAPATAPYTPFPPTFTPPSNPTSTPVATYACGGLRGLKCPTGYDCIYQKSASQQYADQQGVCVLNTKNPPSSTPSSLLPDLTLSSLAFDPSSVRQNVPTKVKFNIMNMGLVQASPLKYIIITSPDGFATSVNTGTCTQGTALKAGATCTVINEVIFPTTGSKSVTVLVDPYNEVKESTENNNKNSAAVYVSNGSTPRPTLSPTPSSRPSVCKFSLLGKCVI